MLKENKSKQEIFDKVSIIILCIIIFLAAIFVGSPIKYNFTLMNIIINTYGIIFIFIKKIMFKNFKFIKNKVDVLMLFLLISSTLALILKTYASLYDTITYIFLYTSIYIIYITTSNLNKDIILPYITIIIIIASVMFVIFGIDELTLDFFRKTLFDELNLVDIENIEQRMFSTFGYANAFAIVMAFSAILTIDKYIKSQKKNKIIYGSIFFIQLTGLILSYSRATILFFSLIFCIYLIMLKNKESIIKLILITVLNLLCSFIYLKIFTHLKRSTFIEYIWYISILIYIVNIVLIMLLNKIEQYVIKVKTKYIIIIASIIFILLLVFIVICIKIEEPIIAFTDNSTDEKLKYTIRNIEKNKEYNFVFDVISNVKNEEENIDTYKIKIIEENKYYDTVQTKELTFGKFTGKKEISIFLTQEASGVSIEIETINPTNKNGIIIKSLNINNEKYILNYKFLPTSIVNKVKEINLSHKSTWERAVFIKDGLKAAWINNPIIGIGGNGWEYVYTEVQEYVYYAKESHCYITELLIEFGILGSISYVLMISMVIYELFIIIKNKENNNDKLPIILAIILLFTHSLIDFDMSFAYILMLMYLSISLIFSDKYEIKDSKSVKTIEIFLLIIVTITSLITIYFNYIQVYIEYKEKIDFNRALSLLPYNREYRHNYIFSDLIDSEQRVKELNKMIEYEPFYNTPLYCEKLVVNALTSNINEKEKINQIEKAYVILKNEPIIADIHINNNNITSINFISTILEMNEQENIKQYFKKYDQIIINNYKGYLSKMVERKNNRLTEQEIYKIYINTKSIYDMVIKSNI